MIDAKSRLRISAPMALLLMSLWLIASRCVAGASELKLYVLDCGHASFKDMGGFSDTGEYAGKPGEIAIAVLLDPASEGQPVVGCRARRPIRGEQGRQRRRAGRTRDRSA